jgi:TRAP-type C4-dicarboxylate transport system substrate-binding protein
VLPILEAQVNNNFVVVTWSRGGWVNIFSREPVFTPDDLRRQRIATSPDANDMNAVFKTMGFHLVETDMADIGPRLANNMINACYQSPAAVAPLGLHRSLRNMLGKPIAPFIGAIVVNRVTWNRISPERQRELMRVTQSIAAEFDALMPRLVANAVTAMGRDGMSVNNPSPAQEEIWSTELLRAVLPLLGTTFNRDLYYRINGILERARSGQ